MQQQAHDPAPAGTLADSIRRIALATVAAAAAGGALGFVAYAFGRWA